MRIPVTFCAAILAALVFPAHRPLYAASSTHLSLCRHDNVLVHAKATDASLVLSALVEQSQVEVLKTQGRWAHIRIWDSITGWVHASDLVSSGPWRSVSTYRAPEVHYHVHAHGPRRIRVWAITESPIPLVPTPGATASSVIGAHQTVRVTGWRQDEAGKVWYHIGKSWGLGDHLRFRLPDANTARWGGRLLWSRLAGKGMWLTLGDFATGDPDTLARAAQLNGITHLYLEAAISPLGFHGEKSVGHIMEAAHKRHIAVVAWVYPYLYDLASDVQLTRRVTRFRSLHGERFDGIAADLERNVELWNLRAYSQLVRLYVGPQYLLVGVPYPPQASPAYPYAEMSYSYNVIAPMDYWHGTQTAYGLDYGHMQYGFEYARRYASDSVNAIRRVAPHAHISPIGQTFDNFGRLEMGPNAPTQEEIRGFLTGSKASGAIGASFFQWMTATDAEWHAIRDFRY